MHLRALAPSRRLVSRSIASALLVFAGAGVLGTPHAHAQTTSPASKALAYLGARISTAPDFVQIVRQNGPAVVNISVSGTRLVSAGTKDKPGNDAASGTAPDADNDDATQLFLRKFQEQFGGSGASMQVPVRGMGSGFIVSSDGLVLTNAHVIAHASEVTVKLTDRREFTARILGSDPKTDVAVLKIEASNLPTVTIGNPNDLSVGEWVLAIGSPFGLDNTVTTGVVSAKARSLPDDYTVPFIQTDAAINPGNSGGPLFNARGEVVGINSQIYTRSGGYQGLSFAIPIDLAQSVQSQIVATGHASHGVLGVSVQEVTQALADAFKLPQPIGALISEVREGTAAVKAGLRAGDVIVGIDGHTIQSSSDLPLWVTMAVPGQQMQIDALRNGLPIQVRATLEDPSATKPAASPSLPSTPVLAALGLAVRPLLPLEQRAANTKTGLLVDAVSDGPSRKAGIEPGDILLAINHTMLSSTDQAHILLAKAGASVALLVQHGAEKNYIPITLSAPKSP